MTSSTFYVLRQLFKTALIHPQRIAVLLDDQSWSYGELINQIERVTNHLYHVNIVQGQIIYQFVERSLEMICGLFGILCAGGVYCPLNPTDPPERLISILKQVQGQYVLAHEKTRDQFPLTTTVRHFILLEKILSPLSNVEDIDGLPDCKERGAALIICTSGTTGRHKAVVHTHKSFSAAILAYMQWDLGLYTSQNQVLQVATSSWILHVSEIMLPLIVGGTLVLLRPNGHLDMAYFSQTLIRQQVMTLTIGSGIISALTNYLEMTQRLETFKFVRNLCMTGNSKIFIHSQNYVFYHSFSI
jgi:non-ribosomal peptide synthetase component F